MLRKVICIKKSTYIKKRHNINLKKRFWGVLINVRVWQLHFQLQFFIKLCDFNNSMLLKCLLEIKHIYEYEMIIFSFKGCL